MPERTRAIRVVRQSQGTDDSLSLQEQRETTARVAEDLGTEHSLLDLGVHTGWSRFTNPSGIDEHDAVRELLWDLGGGAYDYVIAYDDTRLARDQFYWVIEWFALDGGAEIVYVEDRPEENLTWRLRRLVEGDVKRREIEKSKRAVERRREQGAYEGQPPRGLTYDDEKLFLVRGDEDEFAAAVEAIRLRAEGHSYRDIAAKTGIPRSSLSTVFERWEAYAKRADGRVPNPHPDAGGE